MFLEDPPFPARIAYGARGGPEFKTRVVQLASGFEQRNIDWERARGRWTIDTAMLTRQQMAELYAFFMAVRGRAVGFRFPWHRDNIATAAPSPVDGSYGVGGMMVDQPGVFQLFKRYPAGSGFYDHRIAKPRLGPPPIPPGATVSPIPAFQVFVNGAAAGADYNLTTNTIALGAGPNDAVTWQGAFDFACRFDTDHFAPAIEELNAEQWAGIEIVELKLP